MIPTRTVHAGYAVTMALLVLLALGSGGDVGWGAWGAIAAMSALYLLLGRRALEASAAAAATEARLPPEPTALVFLALVIPAATWGVASLSSFAVVQCVLCPLVWLLLDRVRDAVIGTLVLTGSIAVGFVVGFGDLPGALPTMALSQGLSLVGTIALGLWITRIADLSRERLELLEGLRAAQAQVEELGREAGTARERERLSADIHDTVAQDLTGLVMLAQRGRRELRGGDADATGATLAELEEGARDALTQTRAIVAATAPMELTDGLGHRRSPGSASACPARQASRSRCGPTPAADPSTATPRSSSSAAPRRASRTCAATQTPPPWSSASTATAGTSCS